MPDPMTEDELFELLEEVAGIAARDYRATVIIGRTIIHRADDFIDREIIGLHFTRPPIAEDHRVLHDAYWRQMATVMVHTHDMIASIAEETGMPIEDVLARLRAIAEEIKQSGGSTRRFDI